MNREVIATKDGSHTIAIADMQVTYHSVHGAIQESRHVFIEAGFTYVRNQLPHQPICIFEMGFGTGLNALLTAIEAEQTQTPIFYTAIEQYPLTANEYAHLNYCCLLNCNEGLLQQMHDCPWNEAVKITPFFTLQKIQNSLIHYQTVQRFHLIYYDAFAPSAQPELWTQTVFEKLHQRLHTNGILVTYCSKGDVRRAMTAAGFSVTKLPGPPGKREMVRGNRPL